MLLKTFQPLSRRPGSILLDSCPELLPQKSQSLMAASPFRVLESKGDTVRILDSGGEKIFKGDGLEWLEKLLAIRRPAQQENSFYGPGAVGYVSYELGNRIQKIPTLPKDDLDLPDLWFAFYDRVVLSDGVNRKTIFLGGEPPTPIADRAWPSPSRRADPFPSCSLGFSDYQKSFEKAMDHIGQGNIYQVNLCQRFTTPFFSDPWETYLKLRISHPALFSAFVNTGTRQILSSSPELFLKKEGSRIETRPIKGTVRRTGSPVEDELLEKGLKKSEKDVAEHIMIVDLERNDLGRICATGNIFPNDLFRVERCGSVSHLVSTVSGNLREGAGIRDIFHAMFPGGSVTGAPKKRGMEIIGTLEPVVRGIYTGALGWIGFNGNFIFNIPIRTVLVQDLFAHFYSGGGIVADSTARGEYLESLDKGLAFLKILGIEVHDPYPALL